MSEEFDANIEKAKLAEQAERFEDMAHSMKSFIEEKRCLTEDQRNLFSVAYKNLVGSKRSSWRILSSLEAKQAQSSGDFAKQASTLKKYKATVNEELNKTCQEVIDLLQDKLIPGVPNDQSSPEKEENCKSLVFYHKMKGDYFRYICEVQEDSATAIQEKSADSYKEAVTLAKESLPSTSPIRLGLALNYSVFMYEIVKNPVEACKYAKSAFDDAIAELDNLSEKEYKDSTLIMQLLRDNLTLWDGEKDEQEQQEDD